MKNINDLAKTGRPKIKEECFNVKNLVDPSCFVGWIYYIDYKKALLLTNDLWKHQANGIPHNCFLVAASFDPDRFDNSEKIDQEVILLRVTDSVKLPQDDDLVRSRIDYYQQQKNIYNEKGLDPITLNQMQFGGLECRVLGTFYNQEKDLWLGSDIESFPSAARLRVYRPKDEALEVIVNYIDPIRMGKAIEDAHDLGLQGAPEPFDIGAVRYTSTTRLQSSNENKVRVSIQPSDFLARRTAVLGMTRTGKSNMIKQLVSVVFKTSEKGKLPIGQLIFDLNGEYANANKQDKGALADVFPGNTIRYRMVDTEGFRPLQNNFYVQLNEGFEFIKDVIKDSGNSGGDIKQFVEFNFDQPPKTQYDEYKRYSIRKAAYWAILNRAGFKPSSNLSTGFAAAQGIMDAVAEVAQEELDFTLPDYKKEKGQTPYIFLTPEQAMYWFRALRIAWRKELGDSKPNKASRKETDEAPSVKQGLVTKWVEKSDDLKAMINILEQKNATDNFIIGYGVVKPAIKYHTHTRSSEVTKEIYEELSNGKIVIIDLSIGQPSVREKLVEDIAHRIFKSSMNHFVEGENPPNIVLYIEEAHNLIGKNSDPDQTWPRIAKEGAKYRIALVYATQEVSSMHSNILANTENWFITHLNNIREINELSKFYDFADFSDSLIRSQDVGFARVKTLSGPFVVPVQINKFDPDSIKGK